MAQKSDLEKYVEYGLSGTMEIKGEEKKYWLGEFRERIVFGLTFEQINRKEALKVVEEKLSDSRVKHMILNNRLNGEITGKYMDLSSAFNKNYKSMDGENLKGEIALVLASDEAVDVEDVLMDKMPLLPDQFYEAKNKKLCKKHYEALKNSAPAFLDEFQEITWLDRVTGIKCGVCQGEEKIQKNNV